MLVDRSRQRTGVGYVDVVSRCAQVAPLEEFQIQDAFAVDQVRERPPRAAAFRAAVDLKCLLMAKPCMA